MTLRRWTMERAARRAARRRRAAGDGAPRRASALGVSAHSIICGLLPRPDLLAEKTREFRELYEDGIAEGARAVYDRGIEYLKDYYADASGLRPERSITTLLAKKLPLVVDALRAESALRAGLLRVRPARTAARSAASAACTSTAAPRCSSTGAVYDNVWWHNTLFHGPADDHVVVHFRHRATWDTRFGRFDRVAV